MRIAVMGAGGVGGYVGGLLARAGNDVIFIARGEHLEVIRKQGLTVVSDHFGQFNAGKEAASDPGEVGLVDLVLFTVKTYHNIVAIPALKPMLGAHTSILTLQNGVESYEHLAGQLGSKYVLPGAAYIETAIESPGVIVQKGEVVRIVLGEHSGQRTQRADGILNSFADAGINAELSTDIMKALWTKYMFIVTLAGPTSAARSGIKKLLAYPEGRELVMTVLREVESVGRAVGMALDDDVFDSIMSYIDSSAGDLQASMHTDLERGRPLELDALNGTVVRLGQRMGVPVPMNQCIYVLLKPYVKGVDR